MENKKMKLVITLSDYGAALYCGADVERESFVIDIPSDLIPEQVKRAIEWRVEHNKNETTGGPQKYDTISTSIIYS
jgi:hypothetical protein